MNSVNGSGETITSSFARALAGEAQKKAGATRDEGEKTRFCDDCFKALISSPDVTPDEKILAAMGKTMGGHYDMDSADAAGAQSIVLSALQAALPGPVSGVLARTTLDAAPKVRDIHYRTTVLDDGLKAIQQSPGTGGSEKTVALLGQVMGGHYDMESRDSAAAKIAALDALAASIPGPLGITIAKIALSASKAVKDSGYQTSVLNDGFSSILKDPASTGMEKTLATLGQTAGNHYDMDSDDATDVRQVIIHAIANPSASPPVENIAAIILAASGKVRAGYYRNAVLADGLQAISKHPSTSEDQKSIADLGLIAGNHYDMSEGDAVAARAAFLKALKGPLPGARGPGIASTTISAVQGIGDPYYANAVYEDGFKAIGGSKNATPLEKALSGLGSASGGHYDMSSSDAQGARSAVMEELSTPPPEQGIPEPVTTALARATIGAAKKVGDPYYQKCVYGDGLQAIMKDNSSSGEERSLAAKGIALGNQDDSRAAAKGMVTVLEQILDLAKNRVLAMKEEIDKMAEAVAHPEAKSTVEVQDDFVDVAGVKLSFGDRLPH
jgi:hypothetical protein